MLYFQTFGSAIYSSGSERHLKYLPKIFSLEVSWCSWVLGSCYVFFLEMCGEGTLPQRVSRWGAAPPLMLFWGCSPNSSCCSFPNWGVLDSQHDRS